MTNSADPHQTAPSGAVWSGSALFAYGISSATMVYEIFGHLPYMYMYIWAEKMLYLVLWSQLNFF